VIFAACVALMLPAAGKDFLSTAIGAIIWTVGIFVSRFAAKADPWATKVYIKSLQYQDFYPAREKINTPKSIIKRKRGV